MITLMHRLIDSGHAYAADGGVYFDVRSYPAYGSLSGQRVDHMRPADDTETNDAKRDPRDFALWKGAKPGEPAWNTPWGRAGPAGTWSAPPWPPNTWGPPSTSTAAAWT